MKNVRQGFASRCFFIYLSIYLLTLAKTFGQEQNILLEKTVQVIVEGYYWNIRQQLP